MSEKLLPYLVITLLLCQTALSSANICNQPNQFVDAKDGECKEIPMTICKNKNDKEDQPTPLQDLIDSYTENDCRKCNENQNKTSLSETYKCRANLEIEDEDIWENLPWNKLCKNCLCEWAACNDYGPCFDRIEWDENQNFVRRNDDSEPSEGSLFRKIRTLTCQGVENNGERIKGDDVDECCEHMKKKNNDRSIRLEEKGC